MTMFKHWKLALVAASLVVSGTALAQPSDDKPKQGWHHRGDKRIAKGVAKAKYDVNKDGKLDATEREAMKKDRFAKLDTNHDGVLSFEEAQPLFKHRGGRHRGAEGRDHAGKKQR
jgi:hypothetical protein